MLQVFGIRITGNKKGAKLLKLCHPKRFRLWDWVYKQVFPELLLLGVGGSQARSDFLAGVTFA